MSKKLLEEQSIRKFMKIAGLQPLTNTFLKESETVEEGYGKKMKEEGKEADKKKVKEEAKKADGEKLEEVEDLEEGKEELDEERSGVVTVREDDERYAHTVSEAKSLTASVKGKGAAQKSAKLSKQPMGKNNGVDGSPLQEEEMPEEDMADVEAPEAEAPAADAGGLDVEGLVKELIRVITDKVPGAADVISVEEEGDETEVEMGGEGEGEPGHEEAEGEMGGEEELDEAALEKVVAETVKRVKGRLMESKKATKPTLSKQELAKKVAAKVAERLKKA